LSEVAKAFYASSVDLQRADVTWEAFKAKFLHRFQDVRPEQFHYVRLHMARQRKDESLQDFVDRVCAVALKTVPKV
jgi:hypothetical protein